MSAKKKPTEDAGTVIVRVTGETIFENSAHYAKGSEFETTAERAAALGELVEII